MNKRIIILGIALLVAVFSFSVLATQAGAKQCGAAGGGGMGRGGFCLEGIPDFGSNDAPGFWGKNEFQHIGRYLDLSIEQRQEMQKVRFDFLKKTIDLEEQLSKKRLERRALLEKEPAEWDKIDKLTDEIAAIEANIEKQNMRRKGDIKKILTPDQLEKVKQFEDGDMPGGGQGFPGFEPG